MQFTFNALMYMVILTMELELYDEMVSNQQKLLKMNQQVSKNESSDAINKVLDAISNFLSDKPQQAGKMYALILDDLRTSDERLWFSISLRLGKILLD